MKSKRHIVYLTLLALFFAGLGIVLVQRDVIVDFPVYYLAGQSMISGRTDLYSPDFAAGPVMDYRYPPFFITVFGWLALLPQAWAAYLWYWLCILAIAGCIGMLRSVTRELFAGTEARHLERTIWLIAFFALGAYFIKAIKLGNAHLLMTFLMYGSFYLFLRYRDVLGGLLLSLAVTIKVTPLLAIPYFAVTRRWRYLAAAGLFVVVLNLVPAAYFGFSKNAELLQTWFQHVVLAPEVHERDGPVNLSLRGYLQRHLTHLDYSQRGAGTDSSDTDYAQVNVAALPPDDVNRLWIGLVVLLNAAVLALIWFTTLRKNFTAPNDDGGGRRRLFVEKAFLALGLVICLKLISAPHTAKLYFIELVWPVVALAGYAFTRTHLIARICRYILLFVAAAGVILPLLPGRSVQRMLLVLGTDLYLTLILAAGLALALLSGKRDQSRIAN